MRRSLVALLAVAAAVPVSSAGAAAPGDHPWGKRVKAAKRFAADRTGKHSVGVVDEDRRFHGYRADRRYDAASVVKVMLMVAYLRHGPNDHQPLTSGDRALLGPMIKRSDNARATRVRNIVGNDALVRLANRAGMGRFSTAPSWGSTQITARDQARWMFEIERYIPRRHRAYAMGLLRRIIPSQRWGIPQKAPARLRVHFKGGWAPNSDPGWTVNQVAQLAPRGGGDRFSLAILTRGSPDRKYGIDTLRGIAKRLLKGYRG